MSTTRAPRAALALVLALVLLVLPATPPAEASEPDAATRALAWLAARQGADGSFALAPYVVEAAAQAGRDPRAWPSVERPAYDALGSYAHDYPARLRVAYAAGTAGYDPRDVHGVDHVALARAGFSGGQFGDPTLVNDDMWAILALRAAGVPASDPQVQAAALNVRAARAPDGGWSFSTVAARGSTDMTAMALAALRAAAEDVRGDARGIAFLDATRDPTTGGHAYGAADGTRPSCQNTVWALHGYVLLGAAPDPRTSAFLRGLQRPDGGLVRFQGDAKPDYWCTAEAVPYLAGARHPFPSFAPASVQVDAPHARDPATLRVEGPFSRATWTVGGEPRSGLAPTHVFERRGAHAFSVLAEGDGVRHRAHGVADVGTARPVAALVDPPRHALRHVPVVLDPAPSRDPDGRVVLVEVDWGDGNTTRAAPSAVEHVYPSPGIYPVRVRVQDDERAWSDAVELTMVVRNRPPILADLPARVDADRIAPVHLAPSVEDPDGDPVEVRWTAGARTGTGAADLLFGALGEHEVRFVATDAYALAAEAVVVVSVRNLAPVLEDLRVPAFARADTPFVFSVAARDPDGVGAEVRWEVGPHAYVGRSGEARLPAGAHPVVVVARDADGAETRREAVVVVLAEDEAEPAEDAAEEPARVAPPVLGAVEAGLADGVLRVRYEVAPAKARVVVRWASDGGDGSVLASGPVEVPLPEATVARVVVEAHVGELVASAEVGPLHASAPPLPTPRLDAPTRARAGEAVEIRAEDVPGAEAFRFDLGDAGWTEWSVAPAASATWRRPGAYEVRVEARAADGRTSTAAVVVRVEAAPVAAGIEVPDVEPSAPALVSAGHPADAAPVQRDAPQPSALAAALAGALATLLARGRRGR